MISFISFARRHNAHRTVDSICTRCYHTIGREHNEDTLYSTEQIILAIPNGASASTSAQNMQLTGVIAAPDTI
jgi:hypothetical protein